MRGKTLQTDTGAAVGKYSLVPYGFDLGAHREAYGKSMASSFVVQVSLHWGRDLVSAT